MFPQMNGVGAPGPGSANMSGNGVGMGMGIGMGMGMGMNDMRAGSGSPMLMDEVVQPQPGFKNIMAVPIRVTKELSSGMSNNQNGQPSAVDPKSYSLANLHVFQNIPRETARGVDDLTRMRMALISGIPEEIKWSMKKYLAYSNKAPYMISLQKDKDLLPLFNGFIQPLVELIENFNVPLIYETTTMEELQAALNCLLILRNLAQDQESVQALIRYEPIKKFLLFVLQKYASLSDCEDSWTVYESNNSYMNEIIHYSLDLMEAMSSYMAPAMKGDPYFLSLLTILSYTRDRSMVISILRSLSRLLVRSKADEESVVDNIDPSTLTQIACFLLIELDEELVIASLDFLYQYILPGNQRIKELFSDSERFSIFTSIIPKLLRYNIQLPDYSAIENTDIKLVRRLRPPPPKDVPMLSDDIFAELFAMEEPMRSTTWIRCCFECIDDSEFTQISLWRAYESTFGPKLRDIGRKLLPAVEFIKNVSNAFKGASAMVVTEPDTGKKRFVIKGIQPRPQAITVRESTLLAGKENVSSSKFLVSDGDNIIPAKQESLPQITFSDELSDVSKAAASFLCLVSNDTEGPGIKFCQTIKPVLLHELADIPPMNSVLSEYMDNVLMI
ncbi:Chromatin structure-remodeling complex subunit RSC9 [Nakaseomyces bracarensis]|uniref:Chromatin structure-remodeling complex subunit RSC9 n=1 Tax=Nakaseomyces bracarensis TaxID=273131 RepID=A0ABR4NXP3_9SACH